MPLPIKLISTDFDGTLHTEFEEPRVPAALQRLIGGLQARGAKWVINTGRDRPSLLDALSAARLSIRPDYLVTVEREIHFHDGAEFVEVTEWNDRCTDEHAALFRRIEADLPELVAWVEERRLAMVYADEFSPFCILGRSNADTDVVQEFVEAYCRGVSGLTFVRNDVYARFSHAAYNKGTALAEVARRLGVAREHIFAAGDHFNDLPMLSNEFARWLVAPANAMPAVKDAVRRQRGFVSEEPFGHGVARGLEHCLKGENRVVPADGTD